MNVNKPKAIQLNNYSIFLLFFIVVAIIRFFIFFPTVIDHDESTYIIIANQWLQGKIPYVANVEIKPIGIFLLFAGALKFIGNSIFSIRLITVLFIAGTAFFLYRAKALFIGKKYAMLAAMAYMVMISLHKWTWSPNTEVYFNFFTALGFYVLLYSKKPRHYFYFGIVMGMGFMVKYMVVFETVAFGLYFLIENIQGKNWQKIWKSVPLMVLGFVMPFAITAAVYYKIGYWNDFVFATITIPSNYASMHNLSRYTAKFIEILLGYLPLSILFILSMVMLAKKQVFKMSYRVLAFVWYVFVWIAIYLPGKFPHHYALQAILPMTFFMFDVFKPEGWIKQKIKALYIYLIFAVMAIASLIMQYQQLIKKPDYAKEISVYLNERLHPDDEIFILAHNITYYLCKKEVPNKYVHTTLITRPEHIKSFAVNVPQVFEDLKTTNPRFLVLKSNYARYLAKYWGDYLPAHYKKIKDWDQGKYLCFERKQ